MTFYIFIFYIWKMFLFILLYVNLLEVKDFSKKSLLFTSYTSAQLASSKFIVFMFKEFVCNIFVVMKNNIYNTLKCKKLISVLFKWVYKNMPSWFYGRLSRENELCNLNFSPRTENQNLYLNILMPKLGWRNASVELFGRIYFKTSDIFVGISSLK